MSSLSRAGRLMCSASGYCAGRVQPRNGSNPEKDLLFASEVVGT